MLRLQTSLEFKYFHVRMLAFAQSQSAVGTFASPLLFPSSGGRHKPGRGSDLLPRAPIAPIRRIELEHSRRRYGCWWAKGGGFRFAAVCGFRRGVRAGIPIDTANSVSIICYK
jgi:hypothetical protein